MPTAAAATFDKIDKLLPHLPVNESLELSKFTKIKSHLNSTASSSTYFASSAEKYDGGDTAYEEYFQLVSSTEETKFSFQEIYYFDGGRVNVDAIFSASANDSHKGKIGNYKINRSIFFDDDDDEVCLPELNINFKL